MTERPKCRRCGGPLDIWRDPETGVQFVCENLASGPSPMQTDDEFWLMLASLGGDDVAKLERLAAEDR